MTAKASLLPTFENHHLEAFDVCSCFPLTDSPLSRIIRELGSRTATKETRFTSNNGPTWIRVRLANGREKETGGAHPSYDGHININCQLEAKFSPSRAKETPGNTPQEVEELLDLFTAESSGKVCCVGSFLVPKAELPAGGLTHSLLDLSAKVEETEMAITGVSFEVQNHPRYSAIRWKLRPERKEATGLQVDVKAWDDLEKLGSSLELVSQVLWAGVEELVTEKTLKSGA